jgi:hypothetical protein
MGYAVESDHQIRRIDMIIEKICNRRTESRRDDISHPFGVKKRAMFYP